MLSFLRSSSSNPSSLTGLLRVDSHHCKGLRGTGRPGRHQESIPGAHRTCISKPAENQHVRTGAHNDILSDPDIAALGRYVVTRKPEDIGAFRTPSLRNVARTAPYFHDGSVPTLEAAVDLELYDRRWADGLPVVLSRSERDDLLEFLRALNNP